MDGTDPGAMRAPFTRAEMRAMRRAAGPADRPAGADPLAAAEAAAEAAPSGVLEAALAKLRRLSRRLPFAEDALAALACARDPSTNPRVRLGLLAALAYFVMPVDAVPDLLPLVGFADDAAVLAAAIGAVRGAITDAHRAWARAWLAGGPDGPPDLAAPEAPPHDAPPGAR